MLNLQKFKKGKLKGQNNVWSAKMETQLKKLFPNTSNEDIAIAMGITIRSVRSKAHILGLKKDGHYWSESDCKWLLSHYNASGYGIEELQLHFPEKTKWAIINKYRSLAGLRIDNGNK